MAALSLGLLLAFGMADTTAAAAEDDGLAGVTFHDSGLDEERSEALRAGVSELWQYLEPYAESHDLSQFPATDIWGFGDHSGVDRNCDFGGSGCAYPGRAYVAVIQPISISTAGHEAMHLVQFSIGGPNLGSQCIAEGAAEWYGQRTTAGYYPNQGDFDLIRNDYMIRSRDRAAAGTIPPLSRLHSRSRFTSYDTTVAYPTCFLAFDLLLQIQGGERPGTAAYFRYMAEQRRLGWRAAFAEAFDEQPETFGGRFTIYVESGLETWKFPAEIAQEAHMRRLLDCESSGLWAQRICVG